MTTSVEPEFFELQRQLLQEKDRAAQDRAQLLSTVAQVANLLLRTTDYTIVLADVVKLLGEAVGSDRCAIVREGTEPSAGKSTLTMVAEWRDLEILPSSNLTSECLQPLEWSQFPELYQGFLHREPINSLVADFQDSARQFFERQNVTSVLYVPIVVNGKS
jgi:hypothetical protein